MFSIALDAAAPEVELGHAADLVSRLSRMLWELLYSHIEMVFAHIKMDQAICIRFFGLVKNVQSASTRGQWSNTSMLRFGQLL